MKHKTQNSSRVFRKILFFLPTALFIAFAFFGGSLFVQAQSAESGYQLLADIPTITPTGPDVGGKASITLVDYMKGVFVATIGLAIVLAVVQIVIGGIEYVAAAVPSAKEEGKKKIGGAVGGLLLILLAWVLLQALNVKLLNVGFNLEKIATVGGSFGGSGGATFCRFAMPANQKLGGGPYTQADCTAAITAGSGQVCKPCGGSVGGAVGARCDPITNDSNPCSVLNLTGKFGGDVDKATKASRVCHFESSGRPGVCGDFSVPGGVAVSCGLFQINLSAPPLGAAIGGITNCPSAFDSAFTGSHKNVVVVNQVLYDKCKAAALNPDNNIQTMIAGSQNGTNFSPQWTGATRCGIP